MNKQKQSPNLTLHVYDGFTMLDTLSKFKSLSWRRKYNDCGDFTLYVDDTAENISIFEIGRQIASPAFKETGCIERLSLSDGSLCVEGRFLECWLYMGIIEEIYYRNERHADSIRNWVSTYIIPQHPGLTLGTTVSNTPLVRFQTSYKNVGVNISKFAKAAEIGFRIRKDYDAKKYYFDLYKGVDRSAGQSANDKVYFSDEYANLNGPAYDYDTRDYANYALVMGEGEGSARERVIVDKRQSGEQKRAIYVNASGASLEDGVSLQEYRQQLYRQGEEELFKCAVIESFEGEAVEMDNFRYGVDYDLGDVVTLSSRKWGVSLHQRVTEAEEIFEGAAWAVCPVFGNPAPDTLDLEDLV